MKRIILAMLWIGLAGVVFAADDCVKKDKEYYGSKYSTKCRCADFSYPDVVEAMKPLGIKTESRWVVCSTLDGGEWCVCGVRLSWAERPTDVQACREKKKEVKALADKFIESQKDFGVSMPLMCR